MSRSIIVRAFVTLSLLFSLGAQARLPGLDRLLPNVNIEGEHGLPQPEYVAPPAVPELVPEPVPVYSGER